MKTQRPVGWPRRSLLPICALLAGWLLQSSQAWAQSAAPAPKTSPGAPAKSDKSKSSKNPIYKSPAKGSPAQRETSHMGGNICNVDPDRCPEGSPPARRPGTTELKP